MHFSWSFTAFVFLFASLACADDRATVVIMPDAAKKMVAEAKRNTVGEESAAAFDFSVGYNSPVGLRMQVFPYENNAVRVVVEGVAQERFVGSRAFGDMGDTLGLGSRVELPLLSDGVNDALTVSPGLDMLWVLGNEHGLYDGWFRYGPPGDVFFVATDVDITYLHKTKNELGFYVGVKLSALWGVHGREVGNAKDVFGRVFPDVSVFAGTRL